MYISSIQNTNPPYILIDTYILIIHRINLAALTVALKQFLGQVFAAGQYVDRVKAEEGSGTEGTEHAVQLWIVGVDGINAGGQVGGEFRCRG